MTLAMSSSEASAVEYLRELNKIAEVEIEISKPLKWYLRSTELVFKQACVYYSESDHEKAYVLFMKFSNLILTQLPRHPEYNKTELSDAKAKLKKNCFRAIDILERLRPILEANYLAAIKERKRAQEAAEEAEKLRQRQEIQLAKLKEIQAQMEIEAATKRAEEVKQAAAVATAVNPTVAYALPTDLTNVASAMPATVTTELPSVIEPVISEVINAAAPISTATAIATTLPDTTPTSSTASSVPLTEMPPTIVPRKQPRFFSESGRPLRPVHVPGSIIHRFMEIAAENTRRNIETCGVIAGKLHQDEFTITCLIIPKQTGTSDTCSMTNEEEIVEAQDSLDVMSLGWIHTHPTQSCFLSSVDLHTHMPFQMLMEEAIAIVCAPSKNPNFGIFRLTDPPGLDLINKCPKPGGSFHPHPEGVQIYRELKGPEAHAQIQDGLPLDVIDMRFK